MKGRILTSPEIRESANKAVSNLLPRACRVRYDIINVTITNATKRPFGLKWLDVSVCHMPFNTNLPKQFVLVSVKRKNIGMREKRFHAIIG
jgi:hypothetical protein